MTERDALVVRTDARRSGDRVRVTLTLELPAGAHIEPNQPAEPNLIPTVIDVEGLRDPQVEYPVPIVKDLGWNGLTLTVLEGKIRFGVSGRVDGELRTVEGALRFQPCVGGACLPPRTIRWTAPVTGRSAYSVLHALAPQFPSPQPQSPQLESLSFSPSAIAWGSAASAPDHSPSRPASIGASRSARQREHHEDVE